VPGSLEHNGAGDGDDGDDDERDDEQPIGGHTARLMR
jgi:hypothetical protein